MNIILKQGDVFASSNPQSLGKAISAIERLRSHDNKAEYGHTGIIIKPDGTTVEAVWTIGSQNLFNEYKGQKVLIARWAGMNTDTYQKGFDAIKGHIGSTYPYYRLLMHFLGLGKFIHFSTPVCSELTEKFLINCGAVTISGKNFWGLNPDDLVDEWRISRHFDVIFEGVI
jgi:hypothetical protein